MVFSDALPVQFWDINCQTHNEHQPDGVHYRCFCQPWQCDDEIIIQFQDDPGVNFSLVVYEDDVERETIEFDEISSGLYQLTFTPTSDDSPEYCDSFIQLRIQKNAGFQPETLPDLNTWLTGGPGDDPWTLGSAPSVSLGATDESEYLYVDFAFIEGLEYSISFNYTGVNTFVRQGVVNILDSSFNVIWSPVGTHLLSDGTNDSDDFTFTATSAMTRIGIKISQTVILAGSATINSVSATRSIGVDQEVAKSDCLHIATEHKNTVYASYTYHRNYAGLVYSDISPAIVFKIRIPAIFFHQRFPEEDETILLTDQVVTLNGTMRKQRLLETDYLPYYFHEKIMLVLKQNVEIFDFTWVKQDGYELVEGDRRSPARKAKVWLSRQDFVQRNIL